MASSCIGKKKLKEKENKMSKSYSKSKMSKFLLIFVRPINETFGCHVIHQILIKKN